MWVEKKKFGRKVIRWKKRLGGSWQLVERSLGASCKKSVEGEKKSWKNRKPQVPIKSHQRHHSFLNLLGGHTDSQTAPDLFALVEPRVFFHERGKTRRRSAEKERITEKNNAETKTAGS